MKRNIPRTSARGYTLVEIMVTVAVVMIVGAAAYSMLMNSTTLLAKNLSLNSANLQSRSVLDRIFAELNQSNHLPTLINADGSAVVGSGPAAGIVFDRYIGGPYVVGNPGGGLSATATTFNLFYSADPLASPPVPVKNDVVIMDGSTRALVSSCTIPTATLAAPTPTPAPTPGQMVTVTLQSTLGSYTNPPVSSGTAIAWSSTTQQTAYIVHRKAFVVVPGSSPNNAAQLRLYSNVETVTDFNDPTTYVVLSRSIGTKTVNGLAENTPFSLVTQSGSTFLNIAMRVEDQQFNKRLASQQAADFNTFLRVDTMLRPRNIPSL
ncbi:MAG: PilW family protein [Chthoniobacterales bacterium]